MLIISRRAALVIFGLAPSLASSQIFDPLAQSTYFDPRALRATFASLARRQLISGFVATSADNDYAALSTTQATRGAGVTAGANYYRLISGYVAEFAGDYSYLPQTGSLDGLKRTSISAAVYGNLAVDSNFTPTRYRLLGIEEDRSGSPSLAGLGFDITGRAVSDGEEIHAGVNYFPSHGTVGIFDWLVNARRWPPMFATYVGFQATKAIAQTPDLRVDLATDQRVETDPFASWSVGGYGSVEVQPFKPNQWGTLRASVAWLPTIVWAQQHEFRQTIVLRASVTAGTFLPTVSQSRLSSR